MAMNLFRYVQIILTALSVLFSLVFFFLINHTGVRFNFGQFSLRSDNPFTILLFASLVLSIIFPYTGIFVLKTKGQKLKLELWPDVFTLILRQSVFAFGLIVILLALFSKQLLDFQPSYAFSAGITAGIAAFITAYTFQTVADECVKK